MGWALMVVRLADDVCDEGGGVAAVRAVVMAAKMASSVRASAVVAAREAMAMINAVVGEAAATAAAVGMTAAAMAVASVRRPQLLLLVQEAHDGACHACLDASR